MSLCMSSDQIKEEQRLMIIDCTNKTKFLTGENQRQKWIACVNEGDRDICTNASNYYYLRLWIRQGGADCFGVYDHEPIPADSKYGYYHH